MATCYYFGENPSFSCICADPYHHHHYTCYINLIQCLTFIFPWFSLQMMAKRSLSCMQGMRYGSNSCPSFIIMQPTDCQFSGGFFNFFFFPFTYLFLGFLCEYSSTCLCCAPCLLVWSPVDDISAHSVLTRSPWIVLNFCWGFFKLTCNSKIHEFFSEPNSWKLVMEHRILQPCHVLGWSTQGFSDPNYSPWSHKFWL